MNMSSKVSIAKYFDYTERNTISQVLWMLAFVALTAIGAQVQIPHSPVPYTLQTLFVLLAGAFLGPRNGALSMMLYIGAGAIGVPVFSSAGFGIARLLGPTGGYLLAFPAAAAIVGYLIQKRNTLAWSAFSMAIGLVIIFLFGTIQLNAVLLKDWSASISAGFMIFSWWDVLKLSAAAMTYHEIAKRWPRVPQE
ncbi:MAG: biotin transporter BioY [Bacteroidota bacterium]